MKNYSQYEEQEHILRAFEGRRPGRFLDIGAYNAFEFSNTRALYEMGWSGVMIEPAPGPMSSLVKTYGNEPRIVLVQALVGFSHWDSLVSMHVTDDCVSTVKGYEYEKWREKAKYDGLVMIPRIPVEQFVKVSPRFDFINFDAEGVSVDLCLYVVRELAAGPRCICCENDGRAEELQSALRRYDYDVVYSNFTNTVLVR